MSVTFNEEKKIFRLDTEKSTYVIGVSPEGFLGHKYVDIFITGTDFLWRQTIIFFEWKSRRIHHR